MKQIGKNEVKKYVSFRLREEDLSEVCNSIIFDYKYPGLMSVFEQDKCMVINLEKFYQTVMSNGINTSLANLILFEALEHEIEHLKQYRRVHQMGKRDDKNFAIFKSIAFATRIPLVEASRYYNSLYHEYEADINAINTLLSDSFFIERATLENKEDLLLFNKEMASRITKRYVKDGKSCSPLSLFITDAYDTYKYLSYEEYKRLLDFLYSDLSEENHLMDGKDLCNQNIDLLQDVSSGYIKTRNIIRLIK